MRALVFGGTGMLGRAVATEWRRRGVPVLALDRTRGDITDRRVIDAWVDAFHPQVIINCAAFTVVDECETQEARATGINGHALEHLVAAARERQAALIHISTDYVFDGRATHPIPEDAATNPQSAYGRGKLLGEQIALGYDRSTVMRVSWLFGPGGHNFVVTMHRLLTAGKSLRVVDDQIGRPTYTPFVARALWDLAAHRATGIVH